jgi:hypothetical protein
MEMRKLSMRELTSLETLLSAECPGSALLLSQLPAIEVQLVGLDGSLRLYPTQDQKQGRLRSLDVVQCDSLRISVLAVADSQGELAL